MSTTNWEKYIPAERLETSAEYRRIRDLVEVATRAVASSDAVSGDEGAMLIGYLKRKLFDVEEQMLSFCGGFEDERFCLTAEEYDLCLRKQAEWEEYWAEVPEE